MAPSWLAGRRGSDHCHPNDDNDPFNAAARLPNTGHRTGLYVVTGPSWIGGSGALGWMPGFIGASAAVGLHRLLRLRPVVSNRSAAPLSVAPTLVHQTCKRGSL